MIKFEKKIIHILPPHNHTPSFSAKPTPTPTPTPLLPQHHFYAPYVYLPDLGIDTFVTSNFIEIISGGRERHWFHSGPHRFAVV